jgi:hypothetical protein
MGIQFRGESSERGGVWRLAYVWMRDVGGRHLALYIEIPLD